MKIIHSRVQHAVGQGSFHSASVELRTSHGARHRYDYVYDCGALRGSTASPALLRSIDRLDLEPRADSKGRPVIDVLVLSHYDRDHIIGAEVLVARYQVRRIVVPHLTPQELMLVLASQPGELEEGQVRELHSLATGRSNGNLFGVPVTQILPGNAEDADGGPDGPQDAPLPRDPGDGDNQQPRGGAPESMAAVSQGSGPLLGPTLPARMPLHVAVPAGLARPATHLWRLKFWNRGVSDELLALLFDALVSCAFPLHALDDPDAADELIAWLDIAKNRKVTLAAYRSAIAAHKPDWEHEASGQRLANFLSLGLYSGPAFSSSNCWRAEVISCGGYVATLEHRWPPHWQRRWKSLATGRTGWLGTGDAPLGEADVWADFSCHYQHELSQALTVQVPHHGAAPKAGPRFFNPAMVQEDGMCAVISVGTTNPYGHPTTQVIKEVLAARAHLEIVTEESWLGYQEVMHYEP